VKQALNEIMNYCSLKIPYAYVLKFLCQSEFDLDTEVMRVGAVFVLDKMFDFDTELSVLNT
jgi:hypothetical protein